MPSRTTAEYQPLRAVCIAIADLSMNPMLIFQQHQVRKLELGFWSRNLLPSSCRSLDKERSRSVSRDRAGGFSSYELAVWEKSRGLGDKDTVYKDT